MATIRIVGVGVDRSIEITEDVQPDTAFAPEIAAGFDLRINGESVSTGTVYRDGDVVTATPKAVKLGA